MLSSCIDSVYCEYHFVIGDYMDANVVEKQFYAWDIIGVDSR